MGARGFTAALVRRKIDTKRFASTGKMEGVLATPAPFSILNCLPSGRITRQITRRLMIPAISRAGVLGSIGETLTLTLIPLPSLTTTGLTLPCLTTTGLHRSGVGVVVAAAAAAAAEELGFLLKIWRRCVVIG